MANPTDTHWLRRPQTIRRLWLGGIAMVAGVGLLDLALAYEPHFGIDGTFGFHAWYGFLACVGMILFAKLLGVFLTRPDDHYDRG